MKKVININFQGRVIPIEEIAYDLLKQYVESLRLYFANEEGKDEIINDIEGRIAELFEEVLKKGSTCINELDVHNIINSMGRPEDFDSDETKVQTQLGSNQGQGSTGGSQSFKSGHRLYRDENHKILGGVCSGIANYFNVDPLLIRILFVLFFGIAFWIYIIMWIAIPGSSSVVLGSQRKRLFRDPDNKIIAGVCSGLAQYFSVQVWIPRIIFLIPFLSFVFRWGHWGLWDFPHFLSFSFSPGAIVVYIILWLVLPEAKSTADKLEMKGEKVDLNNIRTTIQGDLEGLKDRASAFGTELKETAQKVGENISNAGRRASAEAAIVSKRSGSSVGNVIATLAKIFAYFILGCILLVIISALFGLGVFFTSLWPAYSFVLNDGFQTLLAWGTIILFIWVPVIAIVTWIIRRIAQKRGKSNIIRLTFLSLWILGLICFVNLIVSLRSEFRYRNYPTEQSVAIDNAGVNKLEIKSSSMRKYFDRSWLKFEPFNSLDDDTIFVKNVRLRIIKAPGDSFQVKMVKLANGRSKIAAEDLVSKINYNISQNDTVLLLDKGIAINRQDKFRNQQVIVTVAVPVGKRIFINDNIGWDNVHVNVAHDNDFWDWENNEETRSLNWSHDVEYIMTPTGLERVNGNQYDENENNESDALENYRKSREEIQKEREQKLRELEQLDRELKMPLEQKQPDTNRYRYTPKVTGKKLTASSQPIEEIFPAGLHNMLLINLP